MKFIFRALQPAGHYFFHTAFIFALVLFHPVYSYAQVEIPETDPVKLFNFGQDAHEKGDFSNAIEFYNNALKIKPEFPEAEYQRGAAFVSLGNLADAEKALRNSLKLREDWIPPMYELGSLLLKRKEFSEAEKYFTNILELEPQNQPAYLSLTEIYIQSIPTNEKLQWFLVKLKTASLPKETSASISAAIGAIQWKLDKLDSARKSFNEVLALDTNDIFALSKAAEFFLFENNFTKAIEISERLVKIYPDLINSKLFLARIYAKSGNPGSALMILERLDASNHEVSDLKSKLLGLQVSDNEGLETLLQKNPNDIEILNRLCGAFRITNPPKALEYCRRSMEIEPNNLGQVISYGAALVQAKKFDNAVSLFQKVLQTAPDNYTAHANLASAFFLSNRFAESEIEYQWLVKTKPELAVAYYFLGITQDRLGKFAEASGNYQRFLSLADQKQNQIEIDKVNLRLPSLIKLVKEQTGKKK